MTGAEFGRILTAYADTEDDPPRCGPVEVGDLLGDDRRLVEGEQKDGGADLRPCP